MTFHSKLYALNVYETLKHTHTQMTLTIKLTLDFFFSNYNIFSRAVPPKAPTVTRLGYKQNYLWKFQGTGIIFGRFSMNEFIASFNICFKNKIKIG